MEYLYKIFFVIITLSAVMVLLLPIVVLLHFFFRKHAKSYMLWGWKLIYLRSICPVALTSIICFFPAFNRKFHLLLSNLDIHFIDIKGVLYGSLEIFSSQITTTRSYRICALIWIAGILLFLLYHYLMHKRLQALLSSSRQISDDIYESDRIDVPVQMGLFHTSIYLPKSIQAQETSDVLKHMDYRHMEPVRRFTVVFITAIHWFNPVMWLYYFWWNYDNEIDADERMLARLKENQRLKYAQSVLNFYRPQQLQTDENGNLLHDDLPGILSSFTICERFSQRRAKRIMHHPQRKNRGFFSGSLLFLLTATILFMLSPIHSYWEQSIGKNAAVKEGDTLFEKGEETVISKVDTLSPDGLERVIQLEMTSGQLDTAGNHAGKFHLTMYDNMENEISTISMGRIFSRLNVKRYYFAENLNLFVGDYNGDGTQELALGQQQGLTEKEFRALFDEEDTENKNLSLQDYRVFSYSIVNIESEDLTVLKQDITVVTKDNAKMESMTLEQPDKLSDIFCVEFGKRKQYYQWNADAKTYDAKAYTEKDIKDMQKSGSRETVTQGTTTEHKLTNSDGNTAMLVSTKTDTTSSEAITSVILSPRKNQVKLEDVHGYFCDLTWASTSNPEDAERYGMLIYNGTSSRTFNLYDTTTQTVYYQQEDGTKALADLFAQFDENDITFDEKGIAIYSLAEKTGDTLKINFSAEADGGITVKGSYEYSVTRRKSANLNFSRTITKGESQSQE